MSVFSRVTENDDRDRPDGCARRDANQARISQRVAQNALQGCARQREGTAYDDGQHRPRRADFCEDRLGDRLRLTKRCGEDLAGRQRNGAKC